MEDVDLLRRNTSTSEVLGLPGVVQSWLKVNFIWPKILYEYIARHKNGAPILPAHTTEFLAHPNGTLNEEALAKLLRSPEKVVSKPVLGKGGEGIRFGDELAGAEGEKFLQEFEEA